jgi:hypothetical protein
MRPSTLRKEPLPSYRQLDDTALSLYREISRIRNFLRCPNSLPDVPENLAMDFYSLTRVLRAYNDLCAQFIRDSLSVRNRKELV